VAIPSTPDETQLRRTAREGPARHSALLLNKVSKGQQPSQRWTLKEISEKTGISLSNISAILRGKSGKHAAETAPKPFLAELAYKRVTAYIDPHLMRIYDLLEMMRRDGSPLSHVTNVIFDELPRIEARSYSTTTPVERGMLHLVRGELFLSIREHLAEISTVEREALHDLMSGWKWGIQDIRSEFEHAVDNFLPVLQEPDPDAFEIIFGALALDRLLVALFHMNKAGKLSDEEFKVIIEKLEEDRHYSFIMHAADQICPSWSRAVNLAELHAVRGESSAVVANIRRANLMNPKLREALQGGNRSAWASKWLEEVLTRRPDIF
jgi:hypothetical protein